jgi:hypothetical protein
MEYVDLPFSGEYDFVKTEYVFQTTHMVAPKEQSLSCAECHSSNGRLANLTGFYMPGRDSNKAPNFIGWACVIAAVLGAFGHGTGRYVSRRRRMKKDDQNDE